MPIMCENDNCGAAVTDGFKLDGIGYVCLDCRPGLVRRTQKRNRPREDSRDNLRRCLKVTRAMTAGGYDDVPEANVTDLLSDLRHFCKAHRLDFDNLNRIAEGHFKTERTQD